MAPCPLSQRAHLFEVPPKLFELSELHGAVDVFRDRAHAGDLLGALVRDTQINLTRVLAVPAGGVPVAARVAEVVNVPLDLAVVSKITLPWNTESGFGAVAFDGSVLLHDALLRELPLSPEEREECIARTRRKVQRRLLSLRRSDAPLRLAGERVVLVDDGLASGFTMLAALRACRAQGAAELGVAVPTGHVQAIERVLAQADWVACLNVRGGASFAVADAYLAWRDVLEVEVERILRESPRFGS